MLDAFRWLLLWFDDKEKISVGKNVWSSKCVHRVSQESLYTFISSYKLHNKLSLFMILSSTKKLLQFYLLGLPSHSNTVKISCIPPHEQLNFQPSWDMSLSDVLQHPFPDLAAGQTLHTKPPASTREKRLVTELFQDGGCRSDSHIYTQHYNFMLSVFEQPEAGTGRALSSLKHPLNRAFVDAELECSPPDEPLMALHERLLQELGAFISNSRLLLHLSKTNPVSRNLHC